MSPAQERAYREETEFILARRKRNRAKYPVTGTAMELVETALDHAVMTAEVRLRLNEILAELTEIVDRGGNLSDTSAAQLITYVATNTEAAVVAK